MNCKTILVVEDSHEIRATIEEFLRSEGYPAHGVSNGKDALAILRSMPPGPTLVLLDMMMPVMSGWEFLKIQKADAKIAHIPIVVISALDVASALVEKSILGSTRAYLRKPIDLDALMKIVRLHCAGVSDDAEASTLEASDAYPLV